MTSPPKAARRRSRIWTFAALIAGLALLLTASASAEYSLVKKWGGRGSRNGQFDNPEGVAIGSSGDVYVADTYFNRIQRFTPTGSYQLKWGREGSANGEFESPVGLAVDAGGDVYVADVGNSRIDEFDPAGNFISTWGAQGAGNGQFAAPYDVATAASGDVYVADTVNNRVQEFNSSHAWVAKWGTKGASAGRFNGPKGIATDPAGNVFVADTGNDRVEKFTAGGTFLGQWGRRGSGNGQFKTPEGIATDAAGNVYVADEGNHRIEKFSGDGTFLDKWQTVGPSKGQLYGPGDVAIDPAGAAYVSVYYNIEKFVQAAPPPPPVVGRSINAAPVSGKVLIRLRRRNKFVPLRSAKRLPVGSSIDSTKGKVRLISAVKGSAATTRVNFSKGLFRIDQEEADGNYTEATLLGGVGPCGSRMPGIRLKHHHGHHGHHDLYGSGKGHYRTIGHHGSGSTPGKADEETSWLTSERCAGTYFAVAKGTLNVRDFTRHRTITLHAGQHDLAPAHK
jgi:sugar lactone lactonase YvrE